MAQPRLLARGLLIVMLGAGLLAAPLLLTFDWAGAASAPPSHAATTTGTAAFVPQGHLVGFHLAPLQAPPADVVISEFRTSGPGSNGHATDEFVEVFNRSGAPISIDGWTLSKSDCAGVPTVYFTFSLGTPLLAGQHYLVGGLTYSGNTQADATVISPADLPDNGGIALLNGATIVDQVGTCPSPSYVEGTPLAALTLDLDRSYDRKSSTAPADAGACVDSNNNTADFFLRTPSDPQNSHSTIQTCGNPTPAPPSSTPRPTIVPPHNVVINEIGWAGTKNDPNDQWIELYNSTSAPIDLTDWYIQGTNSGFRVDLSGIIQPHDYYLLVHSTTAIATAAAAPTATATGTTTPPPGCLVFVLAEAKYDQVFSGSFSKTGELLQLVDQTVVPSALRDSAGRTNTNWWAGTTDGPKSMERADVTANTIYTWFTFDGTGTVHDCGPNGGNPVYGTPRRPNWAAGKIATPSPTGAPTKKPTARPPTPFAHVVINEFLPRAGTDWNHDGTVDTYDEFIELKNLGPIAVDLKNWKLDGDPNLGSTPYTLPSTKLKVGDRVVFYGSQTHVLLLDSGDTVRLINPAGIVFDARTYGPVASPDQSHCRLPDGLYWRFPCFPTPGLENAASGIAPLPPPQVSSKPPPCLLSDTAPDPFRLAECSAYGGDILNGAYWDDLAGHGIFPVPDIHTKWQTLVE